MNYFRKARPLNATLCSLLPVRGDRQAGALNFANLTDNGVTCFV
jgi:hypothetical protein|tara:strand:- start:2250 stop:2381 length:132 start_codon:yes stop_codon:yes gene_type:complete